MGGFFISKFDAAKLTGYHRYIYCSKRIDMSSKPKPPKTRMLSVRVTEAQYQYLETVRERIKKRTGFRVTELQLS